jgi:predicted nucleic-acid-binding Zn-ribbon protein
MERTQYYQCIKCQGIVRFDGGYCENCGAAENYKQSILNKKPDLLNNASNKETLVEYETLKHEVELNRRELMAAFKRLVDVELRLEALENEVRNKVETAQ